MKTRQRQLQVLARAFCDELQNLLNCTVTNGVTLTAVTDRDSAVVVGHRISKSELSTTHGIPLTITAGPPRLFLDLSYRLSMDDEGKYLTVQSSFIGLFSDEGLEHVLLHYDYERGKDRYTEAHIQIEAMSPAWEAVLPQGRSLAKLHLPVGGRRYRPSLEDVVEFLVLEKLTDAKEDWQERVNTGRRGFQELQFRAAVRRHPDISRDVLRDIPE